MKKTVIFLAFALTPSLALAQVNTHAKTWNWEQGDSRTISAYINGKLELSGKKDFLKVLGMGRAGARVFGKGIDVLKLDASAEVNGGKLNLNASASVAGYSLFKFTDSKNVEYKKSGKLQKSMDVSTKMTVPVLGIPLSVTLGVRGSAGVEYGFGISPISAKVYAVPFINAKAYAQVGVDVVVIKAGVGGDLTIIDNRLNLSGEVYLAPSKTKKLVLYQRLLGQNTLNMLNGRVYVYGEIYYLVGSKRGEVTLFSWNGIKTVGTLFDYKKEIPLL